MADAPCIIAPDYGKHNQMMDEALKRLDVSGVYKDLSTIIIIPSLGAIPPKVVSSWLNLMNPPNQKVFRLFAMGMEVGEAFSQTIQNVLSHPDLSQYKYILTMETDNIPPPDGLLKLLSRMEANPQFACIGGLYWTKGDGGVPQIWGDAKSGELNFRPQHPIADQLVECCGTGMGFNLWRLDMFKDERLRKPWFKTLAENGGIMTQDLYFWSDARTKGWRAAVDCNVLVGHLDYNGSFGPENFVW
jgi:hypothetical protein